ncbi:MAG TPA: hypothetical protein VNM48_22675, partial [Chloroflexota bacterium]|nr:hypothetical protein [Chloroflexota bacterium]
MATYQDATAEEIMLALTAMGEGRRLPSGFAYNRDWNPPIKRIVGGDPGGLEWPSVPLIALDQRVDALELVQNIGHVIIPSGQPFTLGIPAIDPDNQLIDVGGYSATFTIYANGDYGGMPLIEVTENAGIVTGAGLLVGEGEYTFLVTL